MPPAFRSTGLTKAYGAFQLGPLDLELEPGVVLGYLGLNGAGKTTTMNCLTGLVRPDRGAVEIAFLCEGEVVMRASVADLVETWRSITFRLSGDDPDSEVRELMGAVRLEAHGAERRAICFDGDAALACLGTRGARHVRPAPMAIDEIAVEIMKRGYRVAAA